MPIGASKISNFGLPVEIPDSEVYLHDDWGDNKLTDRDDSGTTTYNGVEGVYRPEWTTTDGFNTPSVSDERLKISGGDNIHTGLNLNLDDTVTWTWDRVDVGSGGTSDSAYLVCFAETTDVGWASLGHNRSYGVRPRASGTTDLMEVDGSGNATEFITGIEITGTHDIEVSRSPSGEWELLIDGDSQGTSTDESHTDPQHIGFASREDNNTEVDEIKVF